MQSLIDDDLLADAIAGAILPPPRIRRALREAAGLTGADLAALIGCSRQSIWRWEHGDDPRGSLRRRYCAALDALRRRGAE